MSEYDDHRRPLQRALKFGTIALVVLTIISLAIWGFTRGVPGVWGVVIGALIGGGFVLFTALSVLFTANSNVTTTGAVVLGSWLLKIIILVIVLAVIKDMTFYDNTALFVTLVIALVVVLLTEVWGVVTSRVTYVG
nr:hypothetical protein [Corynebacterium deserti]